ncbi:MAG: sulfite exporter TauE/SafE family protein [Candidatus Woesebacteria bacterium]
MNLWLVFLTGLTTGGLSCLAVQGGFLASIIAGQKNKELQKPTKNTTVSSFDRKDWGPVVMFLLAKLLSHTMLGFSLGLLGSVFELSLPIRLVFQAFAAFFMFATAMNLLDVHPIFRYLVFQPPKFISKRIRRLGTNNTLFAPFLLGLFTVFIPCGVTQAMEVNAIALGNPMQSAALMFAFVLGTAPLFSIIGIAMAKLSEGLTQKFLRFVAVVLIGMALVSFNGVLEVVHFPLSGSSIKNGWISFWTPDTQKRNAPSGAQIVNGVQNIRIDITNTGYDPKYLRVQKGIPVKLTLQAGKVYSCAVDFHLSAFAIKEFMKPNTSKSFTFTPSQKGTFAYTCGMGMYTGVLEVI